MNEGHRLTIERALGASTPAAVWEALAPLRPEIGRDAELAGVWLGALVASPLQPHLDSDVATIVAAYPADDSLIAAAARAQVRALDARGLDVPVLATAHLDALVRVLESRLAADTATPEVRAELLLALANVLRRLGPARDAQALARFEESIRVVPHGESFFDLGLFHKWAGRFRAAHAAFTKAESILGPEKKVLFNRALTAMLSGALEDSCASWKRAGVAAVLAPGALPFVEGLAPVRVRVPSRSDDESIPSVEGRGAVVFETLVVEPLSPAHGVVRSSSHGETIVDAGDVIAFDPAPIAFERTPEARPTPVFTLLHVIRSGTERRLRFALLEQAEGGAEALAAGLPDGVEVHFHVRRLEHVCPRCAAGESLVKHEHGTPEAFRAVTGKLVVPDSVPLSDVAAALAGAAGRSNLLLAIPALFEALGDTALAGKHHKTWGVIQRGVLARR